MSKEFEEARLVISADIVYDPEGEEIKTLNDYLYHCIGDSLCSADILYKNIKVELKGFICEQS